MKKYDEACFSRGRMVRKGFNIVKFNAIAKSTEAVIEAVGVFV